ncbi:unnamed protein product [Rhodiola kirilowii]
MSSIFLPPSDIADFHGEDVDGWLYQIERFFDHYQLALEQRLAVIHNYLSGEAREWHYEMYMSWRLTTWESFVPYIRHRFKPPEALINQQDVVNSFWISQSDVVVESTLVNVVSAAVEVNEEPDTEESYTAKPFSDVNHNSDLDESETDVLTDIESSCLQPVCENASMMVPSVFMKNIALVLSWCCIKTFQGAASSLNPPKKPPDYFLNALEVLKQFGVTDLSYMILILVRKSVEDSWRNTSKHVIAKVSVYYSDRLTQDTHTINVIAREIISANYIQVMIYYCPNHCNGDIIALATLLRCRLQSKTLSRVIDSRTNMLPSVVSGRCYDDRSLYESIILKRLSRSDISFDNLLVGGKLLCSSYIDDSDTYMLPMKFIIDTKIRLVSGNTFEDEADFTEGSYDKDSFLRADIDLDLYSHATMVAAPSWQLIKQLTSASNFRPSNDVRKLLICVQKPPPRPPDIISSQLDEGFQLYSTFTHARFQESNIKIFNKCMDPVEKCPSDAKMHENNIHDVVPLTESISIRKGQQLLYDFFDEKKSSISIITCETNAYRAWVQAVSLSGKVTNKIQDVLLLDVTPLSPGLAIARGVMRMWISRNNTIPTKMEKLLSTCSDNKRGVLIQVYEGERTRMWDYNLSEKFKLSGIPPVPRGVPQYIVGFEIVVTDILNGVAEDTLTGKKNKTTINKDKGSLSKEVAFGFDFSLATILVLNLMYKSASAYVVFLVHHLNEIRQRSEAERSFVLHMNLFGKVVQLLAFHPYESALDSFNMCSSIFEGLMIAEFRYFLEIIFHKVKKSKYSLGLSESKIGSHIFEETNINIHGQSTKFTFKLLHGVMLQYGTFLRDLNPGEAENALLSLDYIYNKSKIKFDVNKVDNMFIHATILLDTSDKDANSIAMRVGERSDWHFPDLVRIFSDNYYVEVPKYINNKERLLEDNIPEMYQEGGNVVANGIKEDGALLLMMCCCFGNIFLGDFVLSTGFINRIWLFSSPRPPEITDLEDKIIESASMSDSSSTRPVPRRESPWGTPQEPHRQPKAHRCNDRAEDVIQACFEGNPFKTVPGPFKLFWRCMRSKPGEEPTEPYTYLDLELPKVEVKLE